jgi:hypothetical protein
MKGCSKMIWALLILLALSYIASGKKMTSGFGDKLAWVLLVLFLAALAYGFYMANYAE